MVDKLNRPLFELSGTVLDCNNIKELAEFYIKLLGWGITYEDNTYIIIAPSGKTHGLTFQHVDEYRKPVWPWVENCQQQMAHLDFAVENVRAAVQYVIACGGKVATEQFYDIDLNTTMIDPAGHPFCIGKI